LYLMSKLANTISSASLPKKTQPCPSDKTSLPKPSLSHHQTTSTMATKVLPRVRTYAVRLPISRSYHSYDHPPPSGPFTATESLILSASIPHIPSHGFTSTTLSLGAKDAGYIDASTNLFPSGAFSLVHYHLVTQRLALARHKESLDAEESEGKKLVVGAKVKKLTWERLMANKEVIHIWQEVRLSSSS